MALKNVSNATNVAAATGPACCASIIGLDIKTIHAAGGHFGGVATVASAAPSNHAALNTTLTVAQIGSGTATLEDSAYAGKALRFEAATGAVADAAAVANTYLNHTGKALVSGNVVLAAAP